mmetsp:Transcript_63121/g.104238  ORF Transcript_63121/g.104238 Transcript_63121/m.104238 type:complete len:527 (+) Transcript_63121:197-1777(+)
MKCVACMRCVGLHNKVVGPNPSGLVEGQCPREPLLCWSLYRERTNVRQHRRIEHRHGPRWCLQCDCQWCVAGVHEAEQVHSARVLWVILRDVGRVLLAGLQADYGLQGGQAQGVRTGLAAAPYRTEQRLAGAGHCELPVRAVRVAVPRPIRRRACAQVPTSHAGPYGTRASERRFTVQHRPRVQHRPGLRALSVVPTRPLPLASLLRFLTPLLLFLPALLPSLLLLLTPLPLFLTPLFLTPLLLPLAPLPLLLSLRLDPLLFLPVPLAPALLSFLCLLPTLLCVVPSAVGGPPPTSSLLLFLLFMLSIFSVSSLVVLVAPIPSALLIPVPLAVLLTCIPVLALLLLRKLFTLFTSYLTLRSSSGVLIFIPIPILLVVISVLLVLLTSFLIIISPSIRLVLISVLILLVLIFILFIPIPISVLILLIRISALLLTLPLLYPPFLPLGSPLFLLLALLSTTRVPPTVPLVSLSIPILLGPKSVLLVLLTLPLLLASLLAPEPLTVFCVLIQPLLSPTIFFPLQSKWLE